MEHATRNAHSEAGKGPSDHVARIERTLIPVEAIGTAVAGGRAEVSKKKGVERVKDNLGARRRVSIGPIQVVRMMGCRRAAVGDRDGKIPRCLRSGKVAVFRWYTNKPELGCKAQVPHLAICMWLKTNSVRHTSVQIS